MIVSKCKTFSYRLFQLLCSVVTQHQVAGKCDGPYYYGGSRLHNTCIIGAYTCPRNYLVIFRKYYLIKNN
jgi:hypothetical protein